MQESAPYLNLSLPPGTSSRPFVYINMVCTVDGKATAPDSYLPLSGPYDKEGMLQLRSHADALIQGAETAQQYPMRKYLSNPRLMETRSRLGLPETLPFIIASNRSKFDPNSPLFQDLKANQGLFRPLLLLPFHAQPANEVKEVCEIAQFGDEQLDLQAAMKFLASRGIQRLLCEGGPSFNHSLISQQIADDLFLTIGPKIIGQSTALTIVHGPLLEPSEAPALELLQTQQFGNELMLRYRLQYKKG